VPVPSVAQIGPPPGPAPASAAPDAAGASAAPLEAERVQEEVAEIEQQQLLADPSDYSVAADRTIRIQEDETMGHYADWARVRAGDLRRINRIRGTPVLRVGHRLKIDLSNATAEQFESARIAYHRELQEQFFASHRIVATNEHVVKAGESIWLLAERQFNVPVWLLRQYNPDLDLANVKPSTRVVIPVLAGPGA
jgi:membrane-bound lytic murein transglycosylase D